MNKPSDNLSCLIVSMVGFLMAFVFQHEVLEMRRPSLACVSLMAPGPSRQRAGLTATGFYTGAPLLRLPGATYLLPCPPTQQVLEHQPDFLYLSQYLYLHFAILVDENLNIFCVPSTHQLASQVRAH